MQGETFKPLERKTILVIDDEKNIRTFLRRVLEKNGYLVVVASSGEEGLNLLTIGNPVDMIVLDLNLPQLSGLRLLEAIRQQRPEIKILLTSGLSCDVEMKEIAEKESIPFLEKPYDNKTLLRNIQGVIP